MVKQNIHAIVMAGESCNLACTYCYVLQKPPDRMSSALAEKVVDELLHHNDPAYPTRFIWHGGEPTMAGINFYKHICEYIHSNYQEYNIEHYIQTNGTLLTEKWIDFFLKENFRVGVSLDGWKEIHDGCRTTRSGRGSFDIIFRNIKRAREKGLFVGVLSVITRHTLGHEKELFQFFYENKLDFGFHPITPLTPQMKENLSITPQEFAEVTINLLDLGLYQPEPRVTDVTPTMHYVMALMMGCPSGFCVLSEACANEYISIEPTGLVCACDRFAGNPMLSFGNIAEDSLETILQSPVRRKFLDRWELIKSKCSGCEWSSVCYGGCPHEAYARTGSILEPDANCEAYKLIFQHVSNVISRELVKVTGETRP